MKQRILQLVCVCAGVISLALPARADIMDVDVAGVDAQYRSVFLQAEAFWETRIKGYSSRLPDVVKRQLNKLRISASTADIDGAGGVLGQAGPVNVLRYGGQSLNGRTGRPIAIAQTAIMQFDNADMAAMAATGQLLDVVKHEMAHAMGFGSLWSDNGLLTQVGGGLPNYTGSFALNQYRRDSGRRFAFFVPVEQAGGGGTAGSHWDDDDPFFNQRNRNGSSDLMLGSIDLGNERKFTSETTWAAFADLWFAVDGFNGSDLFRVGPRNRRIWPKWSGGRPIFITSVPEPGSTAVLAIGSLLLGLGWRRRSA